MTETYYVGAYWLREDSLEECARRAASLLQNMARQDATFTRWFEQARTRKQALELPFEPTPTTLQTLFGKKTYQRPGGGVSFWAWTGHEQARAGAVRLRCGRAVPPTPNACIINPPHQGPAAEHLLTAPVMAGLLRSTALAWEPDWGIAMSDAHQDLHPARERQDVLVGWVTYLSRRRGAVPPLPSPVRVEQVEDKGTLITLTPERFTAHNPEHLALAARVRERLREAGLLGPLQP